MATKAKAKAVTPRRVIAVPMGWMEGQRDVRFVDIPTEEDGSEWNVVGAVTFSEIPHIVFEPPSPTPVDKMIPALEMYAQKMLSYLRESEDRGTIRLRESEERMQARLLGRRPSGVAKA